VITDNHAEPGRRVDQSTAQTRASRRVLISLLLLAMPLMPMAGQAQDHSSPDANETMPHCGPPMDGQVYCKFGNLYECQFIDPNSMERRTGWRWNADILRAYGEPRPAETDEKRYLVAPEVGCNSEPTGHRYRHHGGDGASASVEAGRRPTVGTIYIRPGGCLSSDR
jgi:hypothetical protein